MGIDDNNNIIWLWEEVKENNKRWPKENEENKRITIEVGEYEEEEEEMARTKWRGFEVHHLIVIWGEINEEFAKI